MFVIGSGGPVTLFLNAKHNNTSQWPFGHRLGIVIMFYEIKMPPDSA
jgi:hypothetical protein